MTVDWTVALRVNPAERVPEPGSFMRGMHGM